MIQRTHSTTTVVCHRSATTLRRPTIAALTVNTATTSTTDDHNRATDSVRLSAAAQVTTGRDTERAITPPRAQTRPLKSP